MMLTRKNDALMDFDLEKVKETSKENPVFYVQYACVRAKSIIKNCAEQMPDSYAKFISGEANLSLLESEEEVQIIKLLASWPKIVENAAIYFEPHRIAFYLQNLASSFHGMWNYGKENASFRFISPEDAELTAARMVIVSCLLNVIYSGLEILGVEPMEKM
jgi:arginyl-tRNA synthetase